VSTEAPAILSLVRSAGSRVHGASSVLTLKELVRNYNSLVEDSTRRNLWPYAGLAVVTRSSADQEFGNGTLRRSGRAPRTRGLNRNHNPMLK